MSDSSCELDIRLTPRSSKNKILLEKDAAVKAWVTAAPTDNQANRALCELLAKTLNIAKSNVQIVSGATSRSKRIAIEGLTLIEVYERLNK